MFDNSECNFINKEKTQTRLNDLNYVQCIEVIK